jgi:chorismate mutase
VASGGGSNGRSVVVPVSDSQDGSIAEEPCTIEVSARVFERFEELRKQTENEHVPAMSQESYLDALMDTQIAVEEGYYDAE